MVPRRLLPHRERTRPSDHATERRRSLRAAQIAVVLYTLAGGVVGYLGDGIDAAAALAFVTGVSASLGTWLYLQRDDA